MPAPTCPISDPVELLLRRILRHASLLAGSGSIAACATAIEVDPRDAAQDDEVVQPTDATRGEGLDGGALQGPSEAGASPRAPALDAGRREAGPADPACLAPPDVTGFDSTPPGPALVCSGLDFVFRAEGLRPAETFDYVAVRRAYPPRGATGAAGAPALTPDVGVGAGAEAWTHTDFETLSEAGRACATATGALCVETVAKHPTSPALASGCGAGCSEEDAIVTTRGDEVRRWRMTADEMRPFLGAIDSLDDALLLLRVSGYQLRCGNAQWASIATTADGYEAFAVTFTPHCGGDWFLLSRLHITPAGAITTLSSKLLEKVPCCAGRKPAGLRSEAHDVGHSLLGDFLARCAHLEAASVISFERLARELATYGAPDDLIEAARAARADELQHAAIVGRLARARGGELVEPQVEPLPIRTLEEIARENVVEGCVNETYAALIAGYQAEHARDRELRQAMLGIAEDELRHAILAHRVQRWIAGQLDAQALARVDVAKAHAVRALVREAARPIAGELQRAAGLPSVAVAGALVGDLTHSLWAAPYAGAPRAA